MAEHIKFRLTAAKASVTLAFLALLGGLVGPAEGEQRGPSAQPASFSWGAHYLKLEGLSSLTQKVFLKLEYKLNRTLRELNHTLSANFYDKHKLDATFMKIDKANQEFLKIDAANAEYYKIQDANASFLKIVDANNEFLKVDGTAANANKLGGLTQDAFVQGHANVLSGAVTLKVDGSVHPLMQTADGAILIGLLVNSDGEFITIHNGTSSPITGVSDPTAVEFSISAGGDTQIRAGSTLPGQLGGDGSLMTHIQIFPSDSLKDVITLTVSSEPQTADRQVTAVGQMLVGSL
jgi:hypothetical protein